MKTSSHLIACHARRTLRIVLAGVIFAASPVVAEEIEKPGVATHPLVPAIERAQEGLKLIEETINDYTTTIIKRERIGGVLKEHEFISAKIRNRKVKDGKVVVPFAVYLKFLKPDAVAGREVIWVEGKNDNKIVAHESGLLGFKRFHLPPDGFLAMMGQRYPITNIGIQTLIEELLVRAKNDLKYGECEVKFYKGAKVDKYVCTLIEVVHPVQRDHFTFYRARIYIDETLGVPVRYAAWTWPAKPGGEPVLEEEYTYRNIKLNVGLTDADFDPDNEAYDYP
ncbi:MAG: DUF1571 domain-containing protein [Pirellulaceae bacterium]